MTRREIRPLSAHFAFEPPAGNRAAFEAAFSCEVEFMQPDNRLLLAGCDLQLHIPSHNPQLLAMHEQLLAQRLALLRNDSTSAGSAARRANTGNNSRPKLRRSGREPQP